MNDDQEKHPVGPAQKAEFLAKCEECGQLYDRSNEMQVRYHQHPGHRPRQRHNLISE